MGPHARILPYLDQGNLYNNIDVYRNPATYNINATSNPNLDDVRRSKEALQHMFGNKFITTGTTVNWDGSGNSSSVKTLEGHHCLVLR